MESNITREHRDSLGRMKVPTTVFSILPLEIGHLEITTRVAVFICWLDKCWQNSCFSVSDLGPNFIHFKNGNIFCYILFRFIITVDEILVAEGTLNWNIIHNIKTRYSNILQKIFT